jgi:hypothetical protein
MDLEVTRRGATPVIRELSSRTPAGSASHPQGAEEKGAEEHGDADDQHVQQALRDDAYDAEHDRHDHQ